MIWATVSSGSCFYWLYAAFPSSTTKNVTNLISVLTIWWCPYVKSSLVLLTKVFAMTSAFSWQNSVSLCPASFCTPRSNLPVTLCISWLPTFASQSPMMSRTSFFWCSKRSSEKDMATHSSIPACKVPWTAEPGRLQSMGLLRVRHDWSGVRQTDMTAAKSQQQQQQQLRGLTGFHRTDQLLWH